MRPRVIATFSWTKSTIPILFVAFGLWWLWEQPAALGRSPLGVVLHTRLGFLWGFAAIGFLYLFAMIVLLLINLVMFRARAMYERNGYLIYLSPLVFCKRIEDIRDVGFMPRPWPFSSSGFVTLTMRDARDKNFRSDLFAEDPQVVVERIRQLIADSNYA